MTVCVPMWGAECWAARCHLQGREPPLLWAVDLPGYNSSHPVLETPPDDSGPGEQQRQHKRLGPPASRRLPACLAEAVSAVRRACTLAAGPHPQ